MIHSVADEDALNELCERAAVATGHRANAQTWGKYRRQWLSQVSELIVGSESVSPPALNGAEVATADGGYRWGELFDSVVDAALYIRDDNIARIDIETHARSRRLIPSRYHYSSDTGADNWVRLCHDPTYRHHINTTEFWADAGGERYAARMVEHLNGNSAVDFISLGPGDGQKDGEIIQTWLNADLDVLYYPYDVSLPLASRAVQHVRERTRWNQNGALHIKAVLADFRHFTTMRAVFNHRTSPNVVGLLGSLGNIERETKFLRDLSEALGPRDLVALEVRLKSDAGPPEMASVSALHFDFGPLEYYLGIPFDESMIRVGRRGDVSTIPGTDTTVVSCKEASYLGEKLTDIPLQYIHQYEPTAFLAALEKTGFRVVEQHVDVDNAFLECVLRKL